MARVDHHLEAAPGHNRQAIGGEGRSCGGEEGLLIGAKAGNSIEVSLAEAKPSLVAKTRQLHAPAVAGGAHQAQARGIELGTWRKFQHQAGCEAIWTTNPYLTQGTTASHSACARWGTGQVYPDPGAPKASTSLEKGLGAYIDTGTQLQLTAAGNAPGREGRSPGR
jgi:hypothetical protein